MDVATTESESETTFAVPTFYHGNKLSLKKVECSLCHKIVFPPVMHCKNWHLLCNNCRNVLSGSKCPNEDCSIEDVSQSSMRSGVCEKFLEKYVIRCKYFKEDGSGCLEAVLKDDGHYIKDHELICHFREVPCLIPGCMKSIRIKESVLLQHFTQVHNIPNNNEENDEILKGNLDISELIMNGKSGIVTETIGDKAFKCISCHLEEKVGDDEHNLFLIIFRISSIRSTSSSPFEFSTIIHPYYTMSENHPTSHKCRIMVTNSELPDAVYTWEGPLAQLYPLTPTVLSISSKDDETVKLKWIVNVDIIKK